MSSNTCTTLLELTAPNQLEQKFGGTAPNKEEGSYWPPCLPDEDFGIDGKSQVSGVQDKFVEVEEGEPEEDEF